MERRRPGPRDRENSGAVGADGFARGVRDGRGAGTAVVLSLCVLLAGTGSKTPEPTEATLTRAPGASGVTAIVIVAVPSSARVPRLHVTFEPAWLQLPCEGLAEPKETPDGRVSVSVAAVAGSFPLFVTVIV